VILKEVVFPLPLLVNLLLVQLTNAILNPTNVKSLFQTVMMEMHVLMILTKHVLVVNTLLIVLLLMLVPLQLALLEIVKILQRTVMMEMFVPLILVTCALVLVYTLQSLVLVVLPKLELAIQAQQNVFSDKDVPMTVTVLLMEIQFTFHIAVLLVVTTKLNPIKVFSNLPH